MNEDDRKASRETIKAKKAPYWLLWAALVPVFSAFGAWLITTHFPGYSSTAHSAFPALVGALSGLVFALFNILEGCVVAFSPLVLCIFAIPLLTRYHWEDTPPACTSRSERADRGVHQQPRLLHKLF